MTYVNPHPGVAIAYEVISLLKCVQMLKQRSAHHSYNPPSLNDLLVHPFSLNALVIYGLSFSWSAYIKLC